MKIDLHVHTAERSACGQSGEEDVIRAAVQYGLDALAFTDHHCLIPHGRAAELSEKFAPFRVFGGIEMTVSDEDFIVLAVHDASLEQQDWDYAALHAFVRERGGFIFLAHPFRYHESITVPIEAYPPDGIELRSANTAPEDEPAVRQLIDRLGCRSIYTSDAHLAEHVGVCHVELDRAASDERELVELLGGGMYRCAIDAVRASVWRG
ncbi:MAG TPA: PHP domain-containing protein [Phycisphaerae bacterium]|nr:PHP domain-containing protein [Phycisphaerae bacterium]